MSFEIRTLRSFDKKAKKLAKKYRSLKEDLAALVAQLRQNPAQGADLGNNVRKVRMAISAKGKGKSHGARVITYTALVDTARGTVTLLTLYDKAEQDSITPQEIDALLAELKAEEEQA